MRTINDLLIREMFQKPSVFSFFLILGVIVVFLYFLKFIYHFHIHGHKTSYKNQKNIIYQKKNIMTKTEYDFYLKLKPLESKYQIVPQLNLASITTKLKNTNYYTDLFRNIDFAILSRDYSEVLLLIELNDKTHSMKKRQIRDLKVKKICKELDIPLITFYTRYSNHQDYVINRILKVIEKSKEHPYH